MTVYPNHIQIESSMVCDARCDFCYRSRMTRKSGTMTDTLFEKLLSDSKDIRQKGQVHSIGLFYMGEPMVFPRLFEWLQRLREEEFTTVIFTNANALTREKAEKLVSFSDVVSSLTFSLGGYDKATYLEIMGLDYDRVYGNIKTFFEVNQGAIDVYSHCPRYSKTVPFLDGGRWVHHWEHLPFTKGPIPGPMYNYAGMIKDEYEIREDEMHAAFACGRLEHISILWDGRVNLCCMDPEARIIVGDANEKHLIDIFNGPTPTYYRQMHKQGVFDIPLCRDCNLNMISREVVERIMEKRAKFPSDIPSDNF